MFEYLYDFCLVMIGGIISIANISCFPQLNNNKWYYKYKVECNGNITYGKTLRKAIDATIWYL